MSHTILTKLLTKTDVIKIQAVVMLPYKKRYIFSVVIMKILIFQLGSNGVTVHMATCTRMSG